MQATAAMAESVVQQASAASEAAAQQQAAAEAAVQQAEAAAAKAAQLQGAEAAAVQNQADTQAATNQQQAAAASASGVLAAAKAWPPTRSALGTPVAALLQRTGQPPEEGKRERSRTPMGSAPGSQRAATMDTATMNAGC